ncbi:TolB family protein, partial [candidate division KSB1 bacterium]
MMKLKSIFIAIFLQILVFFNFCSNDKGIAPANEENDEPQGLTGAYLGQIPPGETPERFAPGVISTSGREFAITFSPDGKECFYTKSLNTNTIMHAKEINNVWTDPSVASFSGTDFDFEPLFIPDGNRVVFGSMRPIPGTSSSDLHQWYMDRSGSDWSAPSPLDSPFRDRFVMYITFAENGNAYYTGDDGIYFSEYDNGGYLEPVKLDDSINSLSNPAHPYISPDESYLIFDAQSEGNADLYISFKNNDGSWSTAQSFGGTINTGIEELCAFVSYDGNYLFFSRLTDTTGDIYWMDAQFIDDLKEINAYTQLSGEYMGQPPPGTVPELFPPPILQSDSDWFWHCTPVFSPDGTEMLFAKRVDSDPPRSDLFYMKIENNHWTVPEIPVFASGWCDQPRFSDDGDRLYFFMSGDGNGIYYVDRTDTGWSDPSILNIPLPNSLGLGDTGFFIKDNIIYYALWYNDQILNIYTSEITGDQCSAPELLTAAYDADSHDNGVYIDYAEDYLMFTSNR